GVDQGSGIGKECGGQRLLALVPRLRLDLRQHGGEVVRSRRQVLRADGLGRALPGDLWVVAEVAVEAMPRRLLDPLAQHLLGAHAAPPVSAARIMSCWCQRTVRASTSSPGTR